jgi:hypothetical protein
MKRRRWSWAVWAGLFLAAQPAGAGQPPGTVSLTLATQQRLGVKTKALLAEKRRSQIDAFAKVLDPGPLAALDADLVTALAAASASRAEAARSRALNAAGGTVAAKDAEAAEAQARGDAIKAAFLRQRLGLEWGPGIARLSDARREALIRALVSGRAALVHVDTPSNVGQAGARTVKVDVGDGSVAGVVLGPARTSEPRLQSSGLIVEVTGPSAILLSIGLTQSAHIDSGEPQSGVVAPRSAIIRYQGSTWAYVRVGAARFARRLLVDPVPEAAGLFVTSGLVPGDQVVTDGAAGVFAAELGQASVRAK